MTKRQEQLIPLTHDHHHALAQARRLKAAAGGSDVERTEVAAAFERFYREDSLVHFREEEEVLFPLLLEHSDAAPAELVTVLLDHVYIHGLVSRLQRSTAITGAPDGRLMKELAETLQAHIRLEEKELFPLVESMVPSDELDSVVFAPRDRTNGTDPA